MLDLDPALRADLEAVAQGDENAGQDRNRARLYTPAELAAIPPPRYLLKPFIRERGLNLVYGRPASGKSFLVLDWGLRIATGTPWFDGTTPEPGPVIYTAAEGIAGLRKRIEAWEAATGVPAPDRFMVWPEAVNYYRAETAAFETALADLTDPPSLIIVDTLARSMAGGDENTAKDMGMVIEVAERIANRFSAALLVVHHTDKAGRAERGSSSLKGAVDVSIEVRIDGTNLEVRSDKDKDEAAFPTWRLSLTRAAESVAIGPKAGLGQLAGTEADVLAVVSRAFGTGWATAGEIERASDVARSSVYRALGGLVERGLLEVDESGSKGKRYRLTAPSGPVSRCPKRSHGTDPTVSHRLPAFSRDRETEGNQ